LFTCFCAESVDGTLCAKEKRELRSELKEGEGRRRRKEKKEAAERRRRRQKKTEVDRRRKISHNVVAFYRI